MYLCLSPYLGLGRLLQYVCMYVCTYSRRSARMGVTVIGPFTSIGITFLSFTFLSGARPQTADGVASVVRINTTRSRYGVAVAKIPNDRFSMIKEAKGTDGINRKFSIFNFYR